MPVILTFGDSNTHGSVPMTTAEDRRRFGHDIRWPGVMAAALGPGWTLIEEGLPGRTTCRDDPVMGAHMNGQTGLRIALASHAPVDVLTIMLGTNDLKTRFAPTAQRITAGVAGLLDIAGSAEVAARHPGLRLLLICPPPVVETGPIRDEFLGAEAVGPDLPRSLSALAQARGVAFLDAGATIAVSPVDGVHFDQDAHATLGRDVAAAIDRLV
ncbi:MAG: GDSL-like lipase [Rhodobacteraceae bacterium HLUCCA08]|nr:MAG: GDSL-like lipase [Rhodobacteraceae bacterium HLUCCA08]